MKTISDEDTQKFMELTLINKYGKAIYDYKLPRIREELEKLKVKARKEVDEFNAFVEKLGADENYTEKGKITIYQANRKEAERRLKEIGDAQYNLDIEAQEIEVEMAHNAWKLLEEKMTADSISPSDYQYIDMMLSRNSSDETKEQLARKYHYHLMVLDILNADQKQGEKKWYHPMTTLSNHSVNHFRGGDVQVPERFAGTYIHELLKPLQGNALLI